MNFQLWSLLLLLLIISVEVIKIIMGRWKTRHERIVDEQ